MKKLPIGISTFKEIREDYYCYVDKTEFIKKLVEDGKYYFLSRPRRFGKSLFVDTLQEVFQGNKALFEDLYIYEKWDWSISHPVIKIDFAGGVLQSRDALDRRIKEILRQNQKRLGLEYTERADLPGCFLFKKSLHIGITGLKPEA